MIIKTKAKLLTSETNNFVIEGNDVVSHKIRFNIEGEIYPVKSTKEQVLEMKANEGKDGTAELELTSRKENIALRLLSFKA